MQFHSFKFTNKEWLYLRVSFALAWIYFAFPSLWSAAEISIPVGIAKYIPLDIFIWPPMKIALMFISLVLLIKYVRNQYSFYSLCTMSVISIVIFTIEESSGVFNRVSLLSMIWIAQAVAVGMFFKSTQDVYNRMIHFSLQVIAMAYLLSAYSKWSTSGLHWAIDGKYLDLQILKGYYFHWTDKGDYSQIRQGENMVQIMSANQFAIQMTLLFSLFIESCSFLLLWKRNVTFKYGLLLLAMHVGIYVVMGILIWPVILPMVIFTLNPLYHAAILTSKIRRLALSK